MVTRVIGVMSNFLSLDWNISGPGLVLSSVLDLLLVSVGGLVGDDGNISVLGSGHGLVLGLLDGVVSGLSLSLVLSLELDANVGVEDSLVSSLGLSSVEDFVLVGVSSLWDIIIDGLGVGSLSDGDLVSVSVFLFLSVLNVAASLVVGDWNILVMGLLVVSVLESGDKLVPDKVLLMLKDLVVGGESLFFVCLVFCLCLLVLIRNWDLSAPYFGLDLGVDGIFDFIVFDFDVSEFVGFAVLDMRVFVLILIAISNLEGY